MRRFDHYNGCDRVRCHTPSNLAQFIYVNELIVGLSVKPNSQTCIRIGLVGCGWISEIAHMPSLINQPKAKVVALSDLQDERRAVAARFFPGATGYRKAEAVISHPEVDAVVLALPPSLNAHYAIAAFANNKHVYVEKPLATSTMDGQRIYDAWQKSNRVGMIGYNFRRHPSILAAREIVSRNQLGRIQSLVGSFTWTSSSSKSWRSVAGKGGSALFDLASHHIDLVHYITKSEIARLAAEVQSVNHPEDTISMTMLTSDGIVVHLFASSASGRNCNSMKIFGTAGHLDIDLTEQVPPKVLTGDPARSRRSRIKEAFGPNGLRKLIISGNENSFHAAMTDFVESCLTGAGTQPNIGDGLRVLRTIDLVQQSMKGGEIRQEPAPVDNA